MICAQRFGPACSHRDGPNCSPGGSHPRLQPHGQVVAPGVAPGQGQAVDWAAPPFARSVTWCQAARWTRTKDWSWQFIFCWLASNRPKSWSGKNSTKTGSFSVSDYWVPCERAPFLPLRTAGKSSTEGCSSAPAVRTTAACSAFFCSHQGLGIRPASSIPSSFSGF